MADKPSIKNSKIT